ncbi:MAG: type II toxin-antitoxin system YafQ family toxin [Bacteroidales bacterium]|nr:type II toxin-antitoxin system YafQ family toxin [Bacteroidales bacterium]
MYSVVYTHQFKRAIKLCAKRGLDVSKVAEIVNQLRATGKLPEQYHPHKLKGFRNHNTWECHIEADWLLVWEQNDRQLTLLMLDTGTHADLF